MKRLIIMFIFCLWVAIPGFAAEAVYNANTTYDIDGWHVFVANDDIDTTAELMTELDTTYAQLAAADTIEVLSSSAGDITQTVTVTGINSSDKKVSEAIALNTTAGTTAVTSATTFKYIDQVSVNIECAGTITVRRATGDTFITSIPIGVLKAQMAQHFNGEYPMYITSFMTGVNTTTGAVTFELRWYPDDADCLDTGDGYEVLDLIYIENTSTSPYNVSHNYPQPIKRPAGGYLAVYATGGANNADGYCIIQGYDN